MGNEHVQSLSLSLNFSTVLELITNDRSGPYLFLHSVLSALWFISSDIIKLALVTSSARTPLHPARTHAHSEALQTSSRSALSSRLVLFRQRLCSFFYHLKPQTPNKQKQPLSPAELSKTVPSYCSWNPAMLIMLACYCVCLPVCASMCVPVSGLCASTSMSVQENRKLFGVLSPTCSFKSGLRITECSIPLL